METFTPYGKEWEAEAMKLPKKMLIEMIRKANTGTKDPKACGIDTLDEARYFVEGCVNDFEAGISTKDELINHLGEYTGRIMHVFWDNSKKRIRENPALLVD